MAQTTVEKQDTFLSALLKRVEQRIKSKIYETGGGSAVHLASSTNVREGSAMKVPCTKTSH